MASYLHGTVTVGSTATLVCSAGQQNDGVMIQNHGAVPIYLGGPNVTADTSATGGFQVAANGSVTVPTVGGNNAQALYAIVATGTAAVTWLMPSVAY